MYEMCQYINSVKSAFPSLRLVVFTGGECTIDKKSLLKAIQHASSLSMVTRIVTNGYWAENERLARNTVESLVSAGLSEINFSTGDEHASFVPVETICRAVSICAEYKELKSVSVSIEHSARQRITKDSIIQSLPMEDLPSDAKNKILFFESPWVNFRQTTGVFASQQVSRPVLQAGCTAVLDSVNINPNGQFLSCCGLSSEYSPFLKLGTVKCAEDVKSHHSARFNDILKLWLYTAGPYDIMKKLGIIPSNGSGHKCAYCHELLSRRENLLKLLNIDSELVQSIITDYSIKVNLYEKRHTKTAHL